MRTVLHSGRGRRRRGARPRNHGCGDAQKPCRGRAGARAPDLSNLGPRGGAASMALGLDGGEGGRGQEPEAGEEIGGPACLEMELG